MSKVWLVTGSARGLGREITAAVLAAGHQVLATARKPQQLDDLKPRHGDRVQPFALGATSDHEQRATTTPISSSSRSTGATSPDRSAERDHACDGKAPFITDFTCAIGDRDCTESALCC